MAHENLKVKKQKKYNPLRARTLRMFKVGKIRGYIKKVVPNPRDIFGREKVDGIYYAQTGHECAAAYYGAERFDPTKIYFYEVGANDGSYRKCVTREEADKCFAQLYNFEQRQMQIK